MKEEKKKRLNLDELKVQSFVTSLPETKFNTIKGGDDCESLDPNICECENESCDGGTGGGAPATFLPATCGVGC